MLRGRNEGPETRAVDNDPSDLSGHMAERNCRSNHALSKAGVVILVTLWSDGEIDDLVEELVWYGRDPAMSRLAAKSTDAF